MKEEQPFDVIIIGGSYAGLSAAIALGRAIRNVLVIDSGNPCNKNAPQAHNFITWDGANPLTIIKKAREDVLRYPTIKFLEGIVKHANRLDSGFEVQTEKGEKFSAKKLLFATGVSENFPDIKNIAECWGISVLHCPYCHGYEVKDKKTGILVDGTNAVEECITLKNWTKEVTLFTNDKDSLTNHQKNQLERYGINLVSKKIDLIEHTNGQITTIHFADGSKSDIPVIYAKLSIRQHCDIPRELGCRITASGHIKVNAKKKTTVAGVFAAGDNSNTYRTISIATASGTMAGMMINGELILDDLKKLNRISSYVYP
jgi:thioredoxin reductase